MDDIKTPENAGKNTANKSFPAFFKLPGFRLSSPNTKYKTAASTII